MDSLAARRPSTGRYRHPAMTSAVLLAGTFPPVFFLPHHNLRTTCRRGTLGDDMELSLRCGACSDRVSSEQGAGLAKTGGWGKAQGLVYMLNTESHRIRPEGASIAEFISNGMSRTWRGWGWLWTTGPTWQQVFRLGDSRQIWRDLHQQILLRHAASWKEDDWWYGPTCQQREVSSTRVRTLATPAVHAVGLAGTAEMGQNVAATAHPASHSSFILFPIFYFLSQSRNSNGILVLNFNFK
jgi:hypothetical protein